LRQQRLRSWLIKRWLELLIVVLVLSFAVVFGFWWIDAQQSSFSQQSLNQQDTQTLISWELNRQLRIMVVILTTAIAIGSLTEKVQIKGSTLIFCLVLAFGNIISISRFVQSFQLVMHLEHLLSESAMYSHIVLKWEVMYNLFFFKDGVLKDLGWVLVGFVIGSASLLWGYRLLERIPIEAEKQTDTVVEQGIKTKRVKKRK